MSNSKYERLVLKGSDAESWKKIQDKSETHLVVVDCHQEWCGTCDAVQPMLQKLFLDYEDSDNRFVRFYCLF